MEKDQIKRYVKLREQYGKDPELVRAFEDIIEQLYTERDHLLTFSGHETDALSQVRDLRRNLRFMKHEIDGPLNGLLGLVQILQSPNFDEEQKKQIISELPKGIAKVKNLVGFMHPDVAKINENFALEDISRDTILTNEGYMNKGKFGLNFRYEQDNHQPIQIYSNKTILNGILNTLIGNSIIWAPKNSRIEHAFRIDKGDNLEILLENKVSPERRIAEGEGNGIGLSSTKGFLREMGVEFHNYFNGSQILENAQKNKYHNMEKFGYKGATDSIKANDEIYGVQIRIPMSKLREQ